MKLAATTKLMLDHGLDFVRNNPYDEIFCPSDTTDGLKLRRLLDHKLSFVVEKLPVLETDYANSRTKLYQNQRTARDNAIDYASGIPTPKNTASCYAKPVTPKQERGSSPNKASNTPPKLGKKTKANLDSTSLANHAENEALERSLKWKVDQMAGFQLNFARSVDQRMGIMEQNQRSLAEVMECMRNENDAEVEGLRAELAEVKRFIRFDVTTRRRRT